MNTISELLQRYISSQSLDTLEGSCSTIIPGVHIYRASRGSARQPFVYQSGIIVMAQGRKRIYLNGQQVDYGPGRYLVQGVPLPLECEAHSDGNLPLLGISISINPALLQELIDATPSLGQKRGDSGDCGLSSDRLSPNMSDTLKRLLEALLSPQDAQVLGPAIVREFIYRILIGPKGHVLTELAQHDGHYARVARVLVHMHRHYAEDLNVDALSDYAGMSPSSFHRAFRQVTRETPLQYLKKLRLSKAKELMANEGRRANEAAILVGYRSPSQFSREFKRHFQQAPARMLSQRSA